MKLSFLFGMVLQTQTGMYICSIHYTTHWQIQGGASGIIPPTPFRPTSFLLTYKLYEMYLDAFRVHTPPEGQHSPQDIMDPLLKPQANNCQTNIYYM